MQIKMECDVKGERRGIEVTIPDFPTFDAEMLDWIETQKRTIVAAFYGLFPELAIMYDRAARLLRDDSNDRGE